MRASNAWLTDAHGAGQDTRTHGRFFDTAKQAFGQAAFHGLNIALALGLGWWGAGGDSADPCVWYFLNTMLDSTIGLVVLALCVYAVDRLVRQRQWRQLYSGEYGKPPRAGVWAKQVCLFVGIVLVVKVRRALETCARRLHAQRAHRLFACLFGARLG